jgi:hypothetical protein
MERREYTGPPRQRPRRMRAIKGLEKRTGNSSKSHMHVCLNRTFWAITCLLNTIARVSSAHMDNLASEYGPATVHGQKQSWTDSGGLWPRQEVAEN